MMSHGRLKLNHNRDSVFRAAADPIFLISCAESFSVYLVPHFMHL
jgi:hypothetical protein